MAFKALQKNGFSLIEVVIIAGVMAVLMFAMISMQTNQSRSNNYLEFQLKTIQLRGQILGQFLNDPENCRCLFNGATDFPAAGIALLGGVTPTQIGRFNFVTAGVCGTATVPSPFVSNTGVDGLISSSIQLRNISGAAGVYAGDLVINVQSRKEVLGPQELPVSIPVSIATAPAGPNVSFVSCSTLPVTTPVVPNYTKRVCGINVPYVWTANFSNAECAPTACAVGETSVFQGCQGMGDRSGWTPVNCRRTCFVGALPSGFELNKYCPFGAAGNGPTGNAMCTTPLCFGGTIDMGQTCFATNLGAGKIGGYCERICRVP